MPSTSKKQHNLMAAVAHNPAFAKKVGISQEVGKHFMAKDKGKKFAKGGSTDEGSKNEAMRPSSPPDPAIVRSIEGAPAAAAADLARIRREQAAQREARQKEAQKALKESANKYARGGEVEKEKKTAGIFEKAGEKKLAAHERREAAGKEKDTPAIAKKEEAVLKRVKAPKDVQEYEKSEHKSMGYKKGGGVKKYAKQTKRGGSSARMAPPSADSMSMMGGMGGIPGMAHGGGIHHHHYYGGGSIQTPHVAGPENMIKGKGKDGAAKRGRTKVRMR